MFSTERYIICLVPSDSFGPERSYKIEGRPFATFKGLKSQKEAKNKTKQQQQKRNKQEKQNILHGHFNH